jgi:hypothetical protein
MTTIIDHVVDDDFVIKQKMKQDKRMSIYYEFCGKESAVMFATDLAARGLDFPDGILTSFVHSVSVTNVIIYLNWCHCISRIATK